MTPFLITPNSYINGQVQAYYSLPYFKYGAPNNPDFICDIKNDFAYQSFSAKAKIQTASTKVANVIQPALAKILAVLHPEVDAVCVVPRAKREEHYVEEQQYFRKTIQDIIVSNFQNTIDGTSYIRRHTNTRTTHKKQDSAGYINDGARPYPGIAQSTCYFSEEIRGKHILLIDDVYTKTVNIDEDMIQALYNQGAASVVFFAVAYTQKAY